MEVGTLNTMFKAYAPAEMAKRIAAYGIRKVQLDMAFNGRGYDVDELTPELCGEVRQAFADEGIEILAGSGINAENARSLMEQTGIWQVHSSCKDHRCDPTTEKGPVSYAYLNGPHRCDHDVVSETLVRSLVQAVQED